MPRTSKNRLGESFYPLTEGEAREWYRLKYLGTTGYLLVIKRLITRPDSDLVINNVVKFCQEWEITKSSFYRAVNTLASDKKINWEATQGIVLKPCQKIITIPRTGHYPTNGTLSHERDGDSHERDGDSHERDGDSHERDGDIYKERAQDRSDLDLSSDLNQILPLVSQREKEGGEEITSIKEESGVSTQSSLPEQPYQPSDSKNSNAIQETEDSAALCDNSTFVGHGNIAPDGKSRPFDQRTGKWRSVSSDPWMNGINPLNEFKQWVCKQAIAEGKPYRESTAAGEIRNNFQRAGDLWEEYQAELARRQEASAIVAQPVAAVESRKLVAIPPESHQAFRQQLLNKKVVK